MLVFSIIRAMAFLKSRSTALVTGASSGIGEEYAMQLAPRVRHLVLAARRTDLLSELAQRIRNDVPSASVTVLAADLADADDRAALLEKMNASGIVPDVLVNNAGMGDYGEFSTAEWPKLEAMLRLNVEALTHLAHALVPGMIRGGGGAIFNVSSLASLLPIPDFTVYAATKAYVTSFSEALRIELAVHGIRVIAVCPGPVHTGFGDVARRSNGGYMPNPQWFFVPREQVVSESLHALDRGKPRVFPAFKTTAAAAFISALPMALLRRAMSTRPRRR
jgi:short-subunit dehydrogenase